MIVLCKWKSKVLSKESTFKRWYRWSISVASSKNIASYLNSSFVIILEAKMFYERTFLFIDLCKRNNLGFNKFFFNLQSDTSIKFPTLF